MNNRSTRIPGGGIALSRGPCTCTQLLVPLLIQKYLRFFCAFWIVQGKPKL